MYIRYIRKPDKLYIRFNIFKQPYIEKERGKPYGVVVVTKYGMGWSLCHKDDKFDKKSGKALAYQRSINRFGAKDIPKVILNEIDKIPKKILEKYMVNY